MSFETRTIWLFRLNSDGIARSIASLVVRPGYEYIVVSTKDLQSQLVESKICTLACGGVYAFRLTMPDQVSTELTLQLRNFGIDVARTIHVWPAGLPGRGWDGVGSSEWLTTETPIFGVSSDHPVQALSFQLDQNPVEVIATDSSASTTFIRLPHLSKGSHLLTVNAHRSPDLDLAVKTNPAKGFVHLAVREPEPWIPGSSSHTALTVMTDPFDATLNCLWNNEIDLYVDGPEGYSVSIHVKLYSADGKKILSDLVTDSLSLPITPDMWSKVFCDFVQKESRTWKYIESTSCVLEISTDYLGTRILRFDHDAQPLRWALTSNRRDIFTHLVDDTGKDETEPEILFYPMKKPLERNTLDFTLARNDLAVQPPGGLYVAIHPPFKDVALVSTSPKGNQQLKDLSFKPQVCVPAGRPSVVEAFRLLRLWSIARSAGFLVQIRRRTVIRSIFYGIFWSICGTNWQKAEELFTRKAESRDSLRVLEDLVDRNTQFGHQLSKRECSDDSVAGNDGYFSSLARRFGVARDPDLCKFAVLLANCQLNVFDVSNLKDKISQIVDNPVLLRGARMDSLLRGESMRSDSSR